VISFMHFELGGGRVTAAVEVADGAAKVGLAFCSPRDQFERRKGRLISEGRLAAGKHFCELPLVPDERVKKQVLDHLMATFHGAEGVPQWVSDSAVTVLE